MMENKGIRLLCKSSRFQTREQACSEKIESDSEELAAPPDTGVDMDYVPWPANGCNLAEASERTAERPVWSRRSELLGRIATACSDATNPLADAEFEAIEAEIAATCLDHLKSGRLVAYGYLASSQAPNFAGSELWRTLTVINWKESSAAEERIGGVRLHKIRVFPSLLALCRTDFLDGLPLRDAFRQFVLGDPEVAQLGREAVRLEHFQADRR
jgi:hypothetical protein